MRKSSIWSDLYRRYNRSTLRSRTEQAQISQYQPPGEPAYIVNRYLLSCYLIRHDDSLPKCAGTKVVATALEQLYALCPYSEWQQNPRFPYNSLPTLRLLFLKPALHFWVPDPTPHLQQDVYIRTRRHYHRLRLQARQ